MLHSAPAIKAVIFDFGGVLAEEGFREGLMSIGEQNGLSPDLTFQKGTEAVYDSGFVIGCADEGTYWNVLRTALGITMSDELMRREILSRFKVRPGMIELVRTLRKSGYMTCILSDQTRWLDELDEKYHFFGEFDFVFNSFDLGISKRTPEIFAFVAAGIELNGPEILFIDDNEGHIQRAVSQRWHGTVFRDFETLINDMKTMGILNDRSASMLINRNFG